MTGLKIEDLDTGPCGFLTFKDNGTIVSVNQTLVTFLGYEQKSELIGRSIETLLTTAGRIFYQTHFFPLIKLHGKADEIFLTLKGKAKNDLPMICNALRKQEGDDFLNHCVLFSVQQRGKYEQEILAARKQAEDAIGQNHDLLKAQQDLEISSSELDRKLSQLDQANHDIVQFGKLVAHDLQEPIRKIAVFADKIALENQQLLKASTISELNKINLQCQQVRQLAMGLEKFIALSVQGEELRRLDLNVISRNALERVIRATGDPEVSFTADPLPGIEGYKSQIEVLFYNIFCNSIVYRGPARLLEIRLEASVIQENMYKGTKGKYRYIDFLRIAISDNAQGFDMGVKGDIFQVRRNQRNNSNRLSFGLAFCKKILANHFGSISIRSTVDKGTTVTILLPLSQEASPAH